MSALSGDGRAPKVLTTSAVRARLGVYFLVAVLVPLALGMLLRSASWRATCP